LAHSIRRVLSESREGQTVVSGHESSI
jgi:FXSXX-COOH protein